MTLTRDPAVPRRDALLDGATVARALGAGGCERTYAKYRVGESLRVVHRTDAGAYVAGRSFADAAAAYERALPSAAPVGSHPGVAHAPELGAVLWTFPNDRRIAALPLLAGPSDGARPRLGQACAGTRLVAYAAERSATAACLDGHGGVIAFAKVHAGEGAARERSATQSVRAALDAAARHLRVPHLLGGATAPRSRSSRCRAGGSTRCRPAHVPTASSASARALATLHALRPPRGRALRAPRARPARTRGRRDRHRATRRRPRRGRAARRAARPARRRHRPGRLPARRREPAQRAARRRPRVADRPRGPRRRARGRRRRARARRRCSARAQPASCRRRRSSPRTRPAARVRARHRAAATGGLAWHTAASVLARRALTAVNRVREADLRHLDGSCAPRGRSCDEAGAALLVPALRRPRPPAASARALRGAGRALPRRARLRRSAPGRDRAARGRARSSPCRRSASARRASSSATTRGSASADAWAARRERILATYDAVRPSVVLVELWPFGRAKFGRELLPLLEAARRDGVPALSQRARHPRRVAATTRARTTQRACALANAHLDGVLVHSDPRFARFEHTFAPRRAPRAGPLHGLRRRRAGRRRPADARRRAGGLGRRRARRRTAAARGARRAAAPVAADRPADAR